ncbi:hypothetical protein, partial [Citrobacter youngae]|uniref:hypothetical protein n=2 Tax=Enterobacteriaceae TaxID=543 RepID=UPI001953C790
MKQDEVNAYYMPSSYTMYIDSYDPIEKHTNFDNKIFFHEFTHFLQDLTLPYLMRQATIMNNSIYNFIEQCKKKQEVTAPFFWHDDYYVTSQQYEYTWGEGKYIEDFGSIVSHKQQSEHSIGDIEIHRFTLESSNGITYPLSARDFLEYLSLCLQNKRWKKIEHIDIPYNIIRLTIDYLGFNILSDSSKVLLIEFCLYNDNPVAQLFFIHKNMRQDIIRHDTKGTLHIFLKNLVWNSKGNHSYNTSE